MARENATAIMHPPRMRVVLLREDYWLICGKNACAAKILAQMEYWYSIKREARKQDMTRNAVLASEGLPLKEIGDTWVWKSQSELQNELLDDHGDRAIATALAFLVKEGFLRQRNNPKARMDRTHQYLFCVESVQSAVNNLSPLHAAELHSESDMETVSKPQICSMQGAKSTLSSGNSAGTLPKTTPEITAEITSQTTQRQTLARSALPPAEREGVSAPLKGFEAFWQAYPKKRGKADAEKAYRKLKPNAQMQEAILEGIRNGLRSEDWQRDGGQYIPYPATWLTRQGWLDVYELPASVVKKAAVRNGGTLQRPRDWSMKDTADELDAWFPPTEED